MTHDGDGHVIERTLLVRAEGMAAGYAPGDGKFIPLTTISEFNKAGEVTRRIYPAGNVTELSVVSSDCL